MEYYAKLPGGLLWAQAHYKAKGWRTELTTTKWGYCLTVFAPEG